MVKERRRMHLIDLPSRKHTDQVVVLQHLSRRVGERQSDGHRQAFWDGHNDNCDGLDDNVDYKTVAGSS